MSQKSDPEKEESFHSVGIADTLVKMVTASPKISITLFLVGVVALVLIAGITAIFKAYVFEPDFAEEFEKIRKHKLEEAQQMLANSNPAVRCNAVGIIEKYGNKPDLQLLHPLLENQNEDDYVIIAIVETIGSVGDTSHKSWLLPLLSDGREEVRMAAESAMQKLLLYDESK